MNTTALHLMMLQVLDDPTSIRIIVQTKYPDFSDENGTQSAYFLIDHGDCGTTVDANDAKVYDHWKVSDSIGQTKDFNSNIELIHFLDSLEELITNAYVESF